MKLMLEVDVGKGEGAERKGHEVSLIVLAWSFAYCFGKNLGARVDHPAIQFLWANARLLVACVSLVYLVNEFLSVFLK